MFFEAWLACSTTWVGSKLRYGTITDRVAQQVFEASSSSVSLRLSRDGLSISTSDGSLALRRKRQVEQKCSFLFWQLSNFLKTKEYFMDEIQHLSTLFFWDDKWLFSILVTKYVFLLLFGKVTWDWLKTEIKGSGGKSSFLLSSQNE